MSHSHKKHSRRFHHENWERLVQTERQQWQNVDKFFAIAHPRKEDVWLDFGCGPGYFTVPLAQHVRQVIAVDVSPEMLAVCRQRVEEQHLDNVQFFQSDERRLPLPDDSIDTALLANLYHEIDHPNEFFNELRRVIKTDGKMFIIDWKPVESPTGPPMDHRIPAQQVIQTVENFGFPLTHQWDIFPYHYVLEFRNKILKE